MYTKFWMEIKIVLLLSGREANRTNWLEEEVDDIVRIDG